MESFQTWEILYFAGSIIGAALGGAFRTLYNGSHKSLAHTLSVAGFSGLLGFAVIAIVGGDHRQPGFNPTFYMGVAVVVGLSGREQTQIITKLWSVILGRINGDNSNDA